MTKQEKIRIYCPTNCAKIEVECPIGVECPPILTRNPSDNLCEHYIAGEMKYSIVVENVAKMGYERMFDAEWDDLPPDSIERALWKEVALVMVQELWNIYLK